MDGHSVDTFALLDGGSTISVIDKSLAEQVGLHGERVEMSVRGLWGEATRAKCERVICAVEGARGAQIIEHALTVPKLDLPSQTIPAEIIQRVKLQEGLDLSLPQNAHPRILLGQDNYRLLETDQSQRIEGTGLVLSRSRLGWALHGFFEDSGKEACSLQVHAICCTKGTFDNSEKSTLANLDALVTEYFELENLGVGALKGDKEAEGRATKILRETTKKIGDAWETGLLWKSDKLPDSNTRATALKRLHALERKLDKNSRLASLYYKEMDRLFENGYATKVSDSTQPPRERYISHFGVENPSKPGKVRLVFDAAEKTDGISMNDLLDTGPDLLESLIGVILRFRQHLFAVIADIKDMYLRIFVIERDRAAQRFLYRGADRQRQPDVCQMNRLLFGSTSSPCSALYVKNQNAKRFAREKPAAAKSIEKNSYMDDYLASGKTAKEMRNLVRDVSLINSEANFEMHGWASNDPSIVKDVSEEKRLGNEQKACLGNKEERVLGLYWDRESDSLRFNTGAQKIRDELMKGVVKPTKREFISIAMSVYDPLGILSPFLLGAKLIMQDIWRSGVGWDAKIRDQEFATWKLWLKNLDEIKGCKVPRCFIPVGADYAHVQLHIFCDASLQAYAAAAYLRTESPDGRIHLSLVMAKARVAPVKPMTVPRLELQAAVLGTRLATTICTELDITIEEKVFWSDSTTVLHWIRNGPRLKQTFVRNRLGKIGETTQINEWRWVPTKLNPADDATRPSKEPMRSTDRWLIGPEFLVKPPEAWPVEKTLREAEKQEIEELESRREFVGTVSVNIAKAPDNSRKLEWFGALNLANRMRETLYRWYDKEMAKKGKPLSAQSPSEKEKQSANEKWNDAADFWYKIIQSACFPEEMHAMKRGKEIRKGSKMIGLQPFIDERGIARAEGRIKMIGEQNVKFQPIILDARHFATKWLIASYHRRYGHANNETVVNELRQEFYIIGLRRRLRSLAKNCIVCRMRRAKPQNPIMADLPKCRVAYNLRPFTHCGVDYFGPMTVKIGRRHEKRWGVLFTCMTTRAIHLELSHSLSASSAIMAIQRLAGRRGCPRKMYSDNGTNFTKASKELRDAVAGIDNESLMNHGKEKGFEWRFNPPDAPHMGGAWERQIRSVKAALDHSLKTRVPSEEELLTLLIEAEHMVNSRPLTHVSIDPRDEEALTPNHFLIGASSGHLRLERYEAEILSPRKTFEVVQALAQAFWKKWLREYLPTLLPRKKWNDSQSPLKIGDMVLIVDFQAPRNSWRKGKITEIYPSASGKAVRVVKVRTGISELTRPAHKLVKICETQ